MRHASLVCVWLFAAFLFRGHPAQAQVPNDAAWQPEWLARANYESLYYTGARGARPIYPVQVNGYYGYITVRGYLSIEPVFDYADVFYENLARVVIGDRVGFIHHGGKFQVDPVLENADRYVDGRARASVEGKWGFIDKNGRWTSEPIYDAVGRYSESAAPVLTQGMVGYIDRSGRWLIKPRFLSGRGFYEGRAAVTLPTRDILEERWAIIDRSGRTLWVDREDEILELGDYRDRLIRARTREGWGYLDRHFEWAIPPRYEEAGDYSLGMAAVKIKNVWGYIDRTGRWRIDPGYQNAEDFGPVTKVAKVDLGGATGFIDRSGRWLVEPVLMEAEPFMGNYAHIRLPAGWTWLDRQGRSFWNPGRKVEHVVDGTIWRRSYGSEDHEPVYWIKRIRNVDRLHVREPLHNPFPLEYQYDHIVPEPDGGLTRIKLVHEQELDNENDGIPSGVPDAEFSDVGQEGSKK